MLRMLCMAVVAARLLAQIPTKTMSVAGLEQDVEMLVDQWGVPHIYAKSKRDAFFAQGFNAASERLWQVDLWRKRGLGLLSADFGPAYVAQDRAARLFLYRGDLEAEWPLYAEGMREMLEAFTAGVNARVEMVRKDRSLLPWEFRRMGTLPDRWDARDLLRIRSAALSSNATSEVTRAKSLCEAGGKPQALMTGLSVAWKPIVPEGLDYCSIDPASLRVFALAKQTAVRFPAAATGEPKQAESNNWAISATRSATGRAILATDPHRPFQIPAFRYFAHISAPGLDAVGFGEPQHPGFVFGHNGAVAWGQTTFGVDMEDVYVYETNPADAMLYRYRGQWERMRTVTERIAVKGMEAREVTLLFTRHGPVVHEAFGKSRAYAVRAAWLEPGGATFLGSVGFLAARDWQGFERELERYRVPGNNVIYADAKGNVALAPSGNSPRRPNWDGLLPVPGDGRYEWNGIRPNRELPRSYNPAEGYVASANNRPYFVPVAEFAAARIGYQFGEARIDRIREVLGGKDKISFDQAVALQNDYTNRAAIALRPKFAEAAKALSGKAREAAAMLASWDGVMHRDSGAAALYEMWRQEKALPMADALEKAVARTESLLGADWTRWRWGALHYLELRHPLSDRVDAAQRAKINAGGPQAAKGGIGETVGSLGYGRDFKITSGNSSRFVIDVGNWDASRFLHVPGQSGDPESPEYKNLLESWVKEEYNPLLYTRSAVERAAARRVVLRP